MKTVLLLLTTLLIAKFSFAQTVLTGDITMTTLDSSPTLTTPDDCLFGDGKTAELHFLDSLKNRGINLMVTEYRNMDFTTLANIPIMNDFSLCTRAVSVTGYVMEVEPGGVESCNCHSKDNRDTHIYLVADSSVTDKGEAIIVEVTPRFRGRIGTTKYIRDTYKDHTVTVCGLIFQDQEHKANSTIDHGKGNHWRHTTWEIHPVQSIILVN